MWGTLASAVAFGVVLASVIAIAANGFYAPVRSHQRAQPQLRRGDDRGWFVANLATSHGVSAWYGLAFGAIAGAIVTLLLAGGSLRSTLDAARRSSR